jgi:formamidopyrimidine-DNA glycosylase
MPELPEVETIVKGLRPAISGQTISEMEVVLPKTLWLDNIRTTGQVEINQAKALIEGKTITSITRRGKMIIVHISDDIVMLIHLKMTGQLIFIDPHHQRIAGGHPNADMVNQLPVKSTRLIFRFTNGSTLYFNDQRQFGYVKILPIAVLDEHPAYKVYGPEPLTNDFNEHYFSSVINQHPKIKIKQMLLDQSIIAGVGNIYADESLFMAKIHPATSAGHLSESQIKNLLNSVKEVLAAGLKYGGTSSQHYVDAHGQQGTMQDHLQVYRRADLPCPVCGTPIERIVVGGRGTHFCPHCQRLQPYP